MVADPHAEQDVRAPHDDDNDDDANVPVLDEERLWRQGIIVADVGDGVVWVDNIEADGGGGGRHPHTRAARTGTTTGRALGGDGKSARGGRRKKALQAQKAS